MRDIKASTTLSGPNTMYYFQSAQSANVGYGYPKYGTWADAEAFCVQLGGHLPSIHSDIQVQHLSGVLRALFPWYFGSVENRVMVGLPMSTSANKTAWLDGTALDWPGATAMQAGRSPHLNIATGLLGQHDHYPNWYGIRNGTILPFACAGKVQVWGWCDKDFACCG